MKINKPKIFDYDYQGFIDDNGRILEYIDHEAFSQALKLWIASMQGELVRDQNRGGYITKWLLKPMRSVSVDSLEMAIRDGLYQDFVPSVVLKKLEITPDYEERYWHIYMEVYSPDYKVSAIIDEKMRAEL